MIGLADDLERTRCLIFRTWGAPSSAWSSFSISLVCSFICSPGLHAVFLPWFLKLNTSHTPCNLSPPSRPSTSEPAESTGTLAWGSTFSSLQCVYETLNTHPPALSLPFLLLLFFFFNYESITHLQEIWSPPLLKSNILSQPLSGRPSFLDSYKLDALGSIPLPVAQGLHDMVTIPLLHHP